MNISEINQKLTRLYNELAILEVPWQNLITKYNELQSNPETAHSQKANEYHKEIIDIQNSMKAIRDRIHQLENLFSEEPLPLNTDYHKSDVEMIRSAFEATLPEIVEADEEIDQPLTR